VVLFDLLVSGNGATAANENGEHMSDTSIKSWDYFSAHDARGQKIERAVFEVASVSASRR
jgi:hypothetical protein